LSNTDTFDATEVKKAIAASAFWKSIIYLEQTGSTNDVAREMAAQGAPAGTIVVADEQTAGRGRLERRWLAPPYTCLLCSILFRPGLPSSHLNRLTMLCSMAAADAIEQVASLPVALKWPNDLLVRSKVAGPPTPEWRKLAGVLTEAVLTGDGSHCVVVGIGINVNVHCDALPDLALDATSILAETGRPVDREDLLADLLSLVERRHEKLQRGENPGKEWSERLVTLGQRVRVATAEGLFEGVAEAVDEGGALLLRTADGSIERFLAGDVTLSAD
jgi:BirA family biotin operon repressor/biotin-[acetyl-CoA-carboxylase] ligase